MILRKTNSILILLLISSSFAFAQHDHGGGSGTSEVEHVHQPPHGGQMKEVGKYHIEMVADLFLKQDQLSFYLYKGNYKPVLNTGIIGTIIFEDHDGTERTTTLKSMGDERFVAQLDNTAAFHCKVAFIIKDKKISATYIHDGLGTGEKSTYSCTMHPDIKRSSPQKCPKCGMTLVKQK